MIRGVNDMDIPLFVFDQARGILEFVKAWGEADIRPGVCKIYSALNLARLCPQGGFLKDGDYYLSVKEERGNYLYALYGDDNALEAITIHLVSEPAD
jgi:hypothetical protein